MLVSLVCFLNIFVSRAWLGCAQFGPNRFGLLHILYFNLCDINAEQKKLT